MKGLINQVLDYDEVSKNIDKDRFKYTLGVAKMAADTKTLKLPIKLNFIMPLKAVDRLEALVINKVAEIKAIEFQFQYEDVILSDEEIVRLYIPYMHKELNGDYLYLTKTMKDNQVLSEDGIVKIHILGRLASEQLNRNVKDRLEQTLKEKFNRDIKLLFENDEAIYGEKASEFAKSESEEIKNIVNEYKEELKVLAEQNAKNNKANVGEDLKTVPKSREWLEYNKKRNAAKRKMDLAAEGNKLMGGGVDGEKTVELRNITPELGQVIIEGILFAKDSMTIKTGNVLAKLQITDHKTTILVKAFLSKPKWEELDKLLNKGDSLRIQGEAQFDTFDHMNTVMFTAIEKLDSLNSQRKDNCEIGKRVELHVHTKMSSMDGLNETAQVVKKSAMWGHKAVAITDHGVVQAFPDAAKEAGNQAKAGRPIKIIYGLEGYVLDDRGLIDEEGNIDYKAKGTNHIIILAKSQEGLKNIYKLVSYSHLNYFYHKPRIPWSVLEKHREGLIIGSACEAGEVYQSLISYTWTNRYGRHIKDALDMAEIEKIASRYDYLEIQPTMNNRFMLERDYYFQGKKIETDEDLQRVNQAIVDLGAKLGKPVLATTDAHYGEPDDALYRNILMAGQGYKDAENGQGLYMKTTDEMLSEFSYLGEEKAIEVVITNTNKIADMVEENILPVPKGKFPPKIEGDKEILRKSCMEKAYEMYGNPLPEPIGERLEKELSSIINNGYAVMYVSAQMLVQKSLRDGYLVGSRGSVGSSFAATMAGITEVNPLEPHYICPECKHLEWGDMEEFDCGIDMPPKNCPVCGHPMKRDGYTIPFATFLGFDGDKEPDIDLNFAGEYQPIAHKYVGEIFGEKNVYKAGTVGSVADKTAYGYVMKYFEERQIPVNKYDVYRLAEGCTGVKKTTGQHPGGIVIVPDDHEIYEFCPVQRPANDTTSDIVTTHFDYHKIDENLLKLDILGHDVPQMIRQLQDMTGVDPLTIDLTDRNVLSIFNGIDALNIKDKNYKFTHGTFAIPEFGTSFTRQMLDDTQPQKFADLVRISGFSHGTDVWLNNAQDYIKSKVATMREVISTRDDIMNYLILKGVDKSTAFKIMEIVRKGKKDLSEEQVAVMKEHNVPQWYIDSCNKIKYMFPRAHAVAYTMMSFRMAWFKVYYPAEFYATYFTSKAANFDSETILKGAEAILEKMEEIDLKGKNATPKELDEYTVYEVAYEAYCRGMEFTPANLTKSDSLKFFVEEGKILLPFIAIKGVGEAAAVGLYEEVKKKPFFTIEEALSRAKINRTAAEGMRLHGIFEGLPETDQLCMF